MVQEKMETSPHKTEQENERPCRRKMTQNEHETNMK